MIIIFGALAVKCFGIRSRRTTLSPLRQWIKRNEWTNECVLPHFSQTQFHYVSPHPVRGLCRFISSGELNEFVFLFFRNVIGIVFRIVWPRQGICQNIPIFSLRVLSRIENLSPFLLLCVRFAFGRDGIRMLHFSRSYQSDGMEWISADWMLSIRETAFPGFVPIWLPPEIFQFITLNQKGNLRAFFFSFSIHSPLLHKTGEDLRLGEAKWAKVWSWRGN